MPQTSRQPWLYSCFSLLTSSVSCVAAGLVPQWASQTLAVVQAVFLLTGRVGSSAARAALLLTSVEFYPTQIRVSAIGTFSFFGLLCSEAARLADFYLPGKSSTSSIFSAFIRTTLLFSISIFSNAD